MQDVAMRNSLKRHLKNYSKYVLKINDKKKTELCHLANYITQPKNYTNIQRYKKK